MVNLARKPSHLRDHFSETKVNRYRGWGVLLQHPAQRDPVNAKVCRRLVDCDDFPFLSRVPHLANDETLEWWSSALAGDGSTARCSEHCAISDLEGFLSGLFSSKNVRGTPSALD
jgi:hypothetical protein